MKKTTFSLLATLISFAAFAQRIVVVDSSWITNESGHFFDNHITIYNTGEQEGGYKRLIGDTTTLVTAFSGKIEGRGENFATDARAVSGFPAAVKELIRQDAAITALTGQSPIKAIQAKYQHIFTDSAYQIRKDGGAFAPVTFTVNAQGNLRYKIDTLPNRNAILLGEVIRLNNFYNTTQDVELYRIRDYFYTSLDRRISLRLVGSSNLNRSAPARDASTPIPAADPSKAVKKKSKKRK